MKNSINLFTIIFCISATTLFAQNGIDYNETVPFVGHVWDCDEEVIEIIGTQQVKIDFRNGSFFMSYNYHGDGIKESTGDKVRVNSWEHYKFDNEPLPISTRVKLYYHVIVQGDTPDFKWIRYTTVHINKNGIVTFEDEGDDMICNK